LRRLADIFDPSPAAISHQVESSANAEADNGERQAAEEGISEERTV
jgi:hypothetical protein